MNSLYNFFTKVCDIPVSEGVNQMLTLGLLQRHEVSRALLIAEAGEQYLHKPTYVGHIRVREDKVNALRVLLTVLR